MYNLKKNMYITNYILVTIPIALTSVHILWWEILWCMISGDHVEMHDM